MTDLDFCACDYADDFEALVDVHEVFDFVPEGVLDLWFKAYDTSCRESEHEAAINDAGYDFECFVWLTKNGTFWRSEPLVNRLAASTAEAEAILTEAFRSVVSDDSLVEMINKVVEQS